MLTSVLSFVRVLHDLDENIFLDVVWFAHLIEPTSLGASRVDLSDGFRGKITSEGARDTQEAKRLSPLRCSK